MTLDLVMFPHHVFLWYQKTPESQHTHKGLALGFVMISHHVFFTLTNLPTAPESQHTQGLSTGFGYDSSSCVVFCSKKATQFRIFSTLATWFGTGLCYDSSSCVFLHSPTLQQLLNHNIHNGLAMGLVMIPDRKSVV